MFLICLLSGRFYHKVMLNFVKGFLCIYWDNHMVFIFQFVKVVYHIDWFANIKESLHPYREGSGTPLQYSCLENPMDGGAWWATVPGVVQSRTGLSNFTFTFHFHALEKEMATHSSVLAWKIPGTAEPGGLLSMGSHRVGQDWSDLAAAAASAGDSHSITSQEKPLAKEMATHSVFLPGKLWTEEPGRSQRVGQDWVTNTFTLLRTDTEGSK